MPGGVQEFDVYNAQALTTRTPSKTLDVHSDRLQVNPDHVVDIRALMNIAMRKKVVSSHPQSPYAAAISSPLFGDLIVDSPAILPHPPNGPAPSQAMTSQNVLRRCAAVKRTQVLH